MIVYQLLGGLMLLGVVGGLIGLVLLGRGVRARKLDDHPLCRKCGYDLYPKPGEQCPECGADVRRSDAIRIGHRTRHKPMMIWGFVLIVIGVGMYWGAYEERVQIRHVRTEFHDAIRVADEARVDAILTRYPELADGWFLGKPDYYYDTALIQVSQIASQSAAHRRILDRILQEQLDINRYAFDPNGQPEIEDGTALHAAVESGDLQTVETLLKFGADPNLPGERGRPALTYLAAPGRHRQDSAIAKVLLDHGADPSLLDDWGLTPLHYLADHDTYDPMLRSLLDAGVDPNLPDDEGFPPIQVAINLHVYSKTLHTLLEYGANPTILNKQGQLVGTFNPNSSNKNDNTDFWWRLLTGGYQLENKPKALPFLSSPEAIVERAPGILAFTERTPQHSSPSLFERAVVRHREDLLAIFLKYADPADPAVVRNIRLAHARAGSHEIHTWAMLVLDAWLDQHGLEAIHAPAPEQPAAEKE